MIIWIKNWKFHWLYHLFIHSVASTRRFSLSVFHNRFLVQYMQNRLTPNWDKIVPNPKNPVFLYIPIKHSPRQRVISLFVNTQLASTRKISVLANKLQYHITCFPCKIDPKWMLLVCAILFPRLGFPSRDVGSPGVSRFRVRQYICYLPPPLANKIR